jgi:hypothetical protein
MTQQMPYPLLGYNDTTELMTYAELQQSYDELKAEHYRLQLKYEEMAKNQESKLLFGGFFA